MAMEDLHKLQPEIFRDISPTMMKELTVEKKLAWFRKALECCRDSWMVKKKESLTKLKKEESERLENVSMDQLVDVVVLILDCVIKGMRELFDVIDEEQEWKVNCSSKKPGDPEKTSSLNQKTGNGGVIKNTKEEGKENARDEGGKSPAMPSKAPLPTSRMLSTPPPPPMTGSGPPMPPPVKGVGARAPPPPPPPMTGSRPPMPPTVKGVGARAPPPPPPGGGKMLQKRVNKLRRSTQMSSLFQNAQKKMEGTLSGGKSANAVKKQLGGSAGGDRGLDAALAEMAKRSPYIQQVEEDYKNHAKSIMELKVSINSFQTKDMFILIKFQKHVESILGCLTDETQVLSKFEDFPAKKLETLRAAAALYLKLDGIIADLKSKEIAAPLERLLERLEPYFTKLKKEIDAIERIKDEELAKFKSQGIQFDFNNITKIKELMVDISSSCMELAVKERREAKEVMEDEKDKSKTDRQKKGSVKMIWRTFQFAFRIYLFAGGQDDRADKLAKELANEIMGQDS